jgi:hypothetical protein
MKNFGMGKLIGLGVLGLILLFAIIVVSGWAKLGSMENGIVAVNEDMKNVHASFFNNLKSQGLAIEKYGELVIKAVEAANSGRYGQGGVKAAMVAIHEQNPNIPPDIMNKLQIAIEAGYNKFETTQRSKIDRIRVFKDYRYYTFAGVLAGNIFGFPRQVTPDMMTTVSTAETEKTFETKQMETVDPFKK